MSTSELQFAVIKDELTAMVDTFSKTNNKLQNKSHNHVEESAKNACQTVLCGRLSLLISLLI